MAGSAKVPRWRRGTYCVRLATIDLGDPRRNGYVLGDAFGIARRTVSDGTRRWIITHIPTGCRCFFGIASLRSAKLAVRELLRMRSLSRWLALRDAAEIRLTRKENERLENISARYCAARMGRHE